MKEKLLTYLNKFEKQLIGMVGLGVSVCTVVSISARFYAFWMMPRNQKLLMIGLGSLVLAIPVFLLLKIFWRRRAELQHARGKGLLAGAVLIGVVVWLLAALPVGWIPTRHVLTIEALQVKKSASPKTVRIEELRGYDGNPVAPEALEMQGTWRFLERGVFYTGIEPAKLTYVFYTQQVTEVQIQFEKSPTGGKALVTIDGARLPVELQNNERKTELIPLHVAGLSRWLVIRTADLGASFGIISILLFVVLSSIMIWVSNAQPHLRLDQSVYEVCFIVTFFIVLALPVSNFNANIKNFDTSFSFRKPLLLGWGNFRFRVLGDTVFYKVIVDQRNWLVYVGDRSLDDYQNIVPFNDESLETASKKLDGLNARLKAKGITFLFVVPPNKNTIYPEYMPAEIPVLGTESLLDRLITYQKQHGVTQVLDLRPALLEERKARQVYNATDTHWNPYGGWVGYQEILRALQKDFSNLQPHPLEDYQYVDDGNIGGDLSRVLGQITIDERFFHLNLLNPPVVKSFEMQDSTANRITVTSVPDPTLPRLVMYRDSFTNNLMGFLSPHFSRAVYLPNFTLDENFIDTEKPDIVIYEITERFLPDLLTDLK
jgi:alginate O-acetyltransferase complex protein AlgJ